jgi:hypothetical protein
MKLLHTELRDEASGRGGAEREPVIAGALLELSVRLCRGNFLMYHASLGMFAKSSGTGVTSVILSV